MASVMIEVQIGNLVIIDVGVDYAYAVKGCKAVNRVFARFQADVADFMEVACAAFQAFEMGDVGLAYDDGVCSLGGFGCELQQEGVAGQGMAHGQLEFRRVDSAVDDAFAFGGEYAQCVLQWGFHAGFRVEQAVSAHDAVFHRAVVLLTGAEQ